MSMAQIKAEYLERELKRWMRPDAHRFIKPDWRRDVKPNSGFYSAFEHYEQKYRPDQARVPPGSREGGRDARQLLRAGDATGAE